jgi:metal-responsive CopG/Arc/MetJ family transcriptional regulator
MVVQNISVSLQKEVLQKLERIRKDVPKSKYISRLIERVVEK